MPTRPKRLPALPERVDLNIEEIDNLVEDQGVYLLVTPSIQCPNRSDITSNNHVLDCPLCNGNQSLDITAQAFNAWGVIQSINLKADYAVQGRFDIKDALLTTKSGIRLWYWYKIEILDHTSIFNELVQRSGATDKLRYVEKTNINNDPVYLIGADGTAYVKGTDFTIAGQVLTWVTAGPVEGSVYSISYPILPTFRVVEFLKENRYYYTDFHAAVKTPVQLPMHSVLRWDYLAFESGQNEPVSQ